MTEGHGREQGMELLRVLPQDVFNLLAAAGSVGMKRGERVYLVGGLVRDLVLGLPNLDIDLVVEGDAMKAARAMHRRFGGQVLAHERFRTATWTLDHAQFVGADALKALSSLDFISARRETYPYPGALPVIEPGGIEDDLARRDFSINTLAIALDDAQLGALLDPFGGIVDLRGGTVRALHIQSFIDDPTRILRAVRYEQRFGFQMDPGTSALVGPALVVVPRVSGERLWHEFERIAVEAMPERALQRLAHLGVLHAIHPDFTVTGALDADFATLRASLGAPDPFTYLAALLARLPEGAIPAISERLRLSSTQREFVMQLQSVLMLADAQDWQALKPSIMGQQLDPFRDDVLRVAQVLVSNERAGERIAQYRAHWREIEPLLDGHRLQELGIVPGPIYRQILDAVRAAQLDSHISTPAEAEQLALSMAQQHAKESV